MGTVTRRPLVSCGVIPAVVCLVACVTLTVRRGVSLDRANGRSVGRGYFPRLTVEGTACHLFWLEKVTHQVGQETFEYGLSKFLPHVLVRRTYEGPVGRLKRRATVGLVSPATLYGVGPRDGQGRHLLVRHSMPLRPVQLVWVRRDLTQPVRRDDIRKGRLDRVRIRARSSHSTDRSYGTIANEVKGDKPWFDSTWFTNGSVQLAYWGQNCLSLVGNSWAVHTAPTWSCHSEDGGLSWSEAQFHNIGGQSPQIAFLGGNGQGFLLMARPLCAVEEHGPGWQWWEPQGVLRCGEGKYKREIRAPRYPCPLALRVGNVFTGKWRKPRVMLRGHRALELGVFRDEESHIWLAYTEAVGSNSPVSRTRKTRWSTGIWPVTGDYDEEPFDPILRVEPPRYWRETWVTNLPKGSDHPQYHLPTRPATRVVLSASKDAGKTWTEPIPVSDGKHSDWQPQVARVGERVLVAWTRATRKHFYIWAASLPVSKVLRQRLHRDRPPVRRPKEPRLP